MKFKYVAATVAAVCVVAVICGFAFGAFGGDRRPNRDYVSVIYITGTIGYADYDIFGNVVGISTNSILNYIDSITFDSHNKGILLAIDSGGGLVYDTDKIYQALMEYKSYTGRPIKAACASAMCSGAYYIACAADEIYAERTADVGSIGVYLELTNFSELFDKLGVSVDYIRSSENKAMGNSYNPLTDEQRAIYQSIIDECYERFLEIVLNARDGFTPVSLRRVADGRVYTATQGLENGLIDGISEWDDVLWDFEDELGVDCEDYVPYAEEGILSAIVRGIMGSRAKTELEQLAQLLGSHTGEVMYYVG